MAIDKDFLKNIAKQIEGMLTENRQKIDEAFLVAPGGIKLSVGIHIKDDKQFKVTMSHSQKKIDCVKEVNTQQTSIKMKEDETQ